MLLRKLVLTTFVVTQVQSLSKLTTAEWRKIESICGKAKDGLPPKFNSGGATDASSYEQFPWSVSVGNPHQCNGVLISDRHLLTAAHCLTFYSPEKVLIIQPPSSFEIYMGHTDLNVMHSNDEYKFKGIGSSNEYILGSEYDSGIELHPSICPKCFVGIHLSDFTNATSKQSTPDIAIIELNRPAFDITKDVKEGPRPICLPDENEKLISWQSDDQKTKLLLTSFGLTEEKESSNCTVEPVKLRYTQMNALNYYKDVTELLNPDANQMTNEERCQFTLNSCHKMKVLCTEVVDRSTTTCNIDSGAGLIMPTEKQVGMSKIKKRWTLASILSFTLNQKHEVQYNSLMPFVSGWIHDKIRMPP